MVRSERKIQVAASRQELWALLADTDGLNRELKLPPVRFDIRPRLEGGSYLRGEAVFLGNKFQYDEEPYCWVQAIRWSVRRMVERGPLRSVRPGVELAETPDGTEVTVWFEAEPRNAAAIPVAHAIVDASTKSMARACQTFAAYLAKKAKTPYPRRSLMAPLDEERLGYRLTRISEADRGGVDLLIEFLRSAPLEEVMEFRPYELATRSGVERRAVLVTCLHAVRAGILELRWRILCPLCRAPGTGTEHLTDLSHGDAHCPSCNIKFGPEFDRSVEVCFSISSDLRRADSGEATYCIGGPDRTPHARVQWYLRANETIEIDVQIQEGVHVLRSPQSEAAPEIQVQGKGGGAIELLPKDGRALIQADTSMPANGIWRLINTCPWPVLLRCETPDWVTDAATAAEVTALQTFRDAFSSEVLSPGAEIAVRQVALVFTDLKGSTAMYARHGDAPSYAHIRDHFLLLKGVMGARGGGIVKTMGDAVMAAFPDPAEAVAAALEIQRRICELPGALPVKIGVYAGPALAVNAEDRLDYFGQSVNRAARIQAQSIGGDVVIAESLTEDPRVRQVIQGIRAESFLADLKGDSPQVPLLRLHLRPMVP